MLMQITFTARGRENRLSDHHVHLRGYLVGVSCMCSSSRVSSVPSPPPLCSPTPEKIGVRASSEEL